MDLVKAKTKLPIGIQTFEKLREGGYLYVDKTRYLIDLIDRGSVYFLSRPRRFGKSLTISTFDAIFSGKRELFEGLYASEFFDRPEYKPHPVIRLDMSNLTTDMGLDALRSSILDQIRENSDRFGINLETALPGDALYNLLYRAAQKYGATVAILVDEYDKPILDSIQDIEKAEAVRDILRNFYVRIKAADRHLCFVFITGISKFSKVGVFSAMNNLIDISMNDRYAAMLGYTEEELLNCFDAHIGDTATGMGKSNESLNAEIREHYDGFSFDGKTRLYNPFSVLNFFNEMKFKNYWFESGTPSVLVKYVKRHDLEAENFRGLEVSEDFTSVAEIELASPESFLFQSGYLSVRERKGNNLILDYPNNEVLSSVSNLFLYGKYEIAGISAARNNLEAALGSGQPEELIKIYNSLLANLPYDIYEREERKYIAMQEKKDSFTPPPYAESFYHALLFTLLWSSRVNTMAENHSYWGRSDIEAEKSGHRYVVELKVAEGKEAAKKAAAEAMKQIREKGYADKYATEGATLIAIAVDKEKRRVAEHLIE
ncbi:MAG: ATP-binding protein [Synergistaceae bacterium]|nr:ATP-binding protein [Synergistaceae bacterium]